MAVLFDQAQQGVPAPCCHRHAQCRFEHRRWVSGFAVDGPRHRQGVARFDLKDLAIVAHRYDRKIDLDRCCCIKEADGLLGDAWICLTGKGVGVYQRNHVLQTANERWLVHVADLRQCLASGFGDFVRGTILHGRVLRGPVFRCAKDQRAIAHKRVGAARTRVQKRRFKLLAGWAFRLAKVNVAEEGNIDHKKILFIDDSICVLRVQIRPAQCQCVCKDHVGQSRKSLLRSNLMDSQ